MADPISKSKLEDVAARLQAMGVEEADLREEFIRGSGAGGQKINKTNSCVQLTYLPRGIVIKCQHSRSREQNRFFARRLLLERLEAEKLGVQSQKMQKMFKLRAQKKKRSKRAKEKMLAGKKQNAQLKQLRKRVDGSE